MYHHFLLLPNTSLDSTTGSERVVNLCRVFVHYLRVEGVATVDSAVEPAGGERWDLYEYDLFFRHFFSQQDCRRDTPYCPRRSYKVVPTMLWGPVSRCMFPHERKPEGRPPAIASNRPPRRVSAKTGSHPDALSGAPLTRNTDVKNVSPQGCAVREQTSLHLGKRPHIAIRDAVLLESVGGHELFRNSVV